MKEYDESLIKKDQSIITTEKKEPVNKETDKSKLLEVTSVKNTEAQKSNKEMNNILIEIRNEIPSGGDPVSTEDKVFRKLNAIRTDKRSASGFKKVKDAVALYDAATTKAEKKRALQAVYESANNYLATRKKKSYQDRKELCEGLISDIEEYIGEIGEKKESLKRSSDHLYDPNLKLSDAELDMEISLSYTELLGNIPSNVDSKRRAAFKRKIVDVRFAKEFLERKDAAVPDETETLLNEMELWEENPAEIKKCKTAVMEQMLGKLLTWNLEDFSYKNPDDFLHRKTEGVGEQEHFKNLYEKLKYAAKMKEMLNKYKEATAGGVEEAYFSQNMISELQMRVDFLESVKEDYDNRLTLMSSPYYATLLQADAESLTKAQINEIISSPKTSPELKTYLEALSAKKTLAEKTKKDAKLYTRGRDVNKILKTYRGKRVFDDKEVPAVSDELETGLQTARNTFSKLVNDKKAREKEEERKAIAAREEKESSKIKLKEMVADSLKKGLEKEHKERSLKAEELKEEKELKVRIRDSKRFQKALKKSIADNRSEFRKINEAKIKAIKIQKARIRDKKEFVEMKKAFIELHKWADRLEKNEKADKLNEKRGDIMDAHIEVIDDITKTYGEHDALIKKNYGKDPDPNISEKIRVACIDALRDIGKLKGVDLDYVNLKNLVWLVGTMKPDLSAMKEGVPDRKLFKENLMKNIKTARDNTIVDLNNESLKLKEEIEEYKRLIGKYQEAIKTESDVHLAQYTSVKEKNKSFFSIGTSKKVKEAKVLYDEKVAGVVSTYQPMIDGHEKRIAEREKRLKEIPEIIAVLKRR